MKNCLVSGVQNKLLYRDYERSSVRSYVFAHIRANNAALLAAVLAYPCLNRANRSERRASGRTVRVSRGAAGINSALGITPARAGKLL